jgi:hypothetical protein
MKRNKPTHAFLNHTLHGGLASVTLRPTLAEEFAQQFSALLRQPSAGYGHLMVQPGVIQDLENRTHRTCLRVVGGIDKTAKPGVNHSPGAHGAGFQGDKELAAAQAIVTQVSRGVSHGDYLCMRRRIEVAQNPVLSTAYDNAVVHYYRTHWDLTRSARGTRFTQGE